MILLGFLCATWETIWNNKPAETIMAATLFVSIFSMFMTSYIAIENAIELRLERQKKLLSDYCTRFSNDQSIRNVAEWLLNISEIDSDGNVKLLGSKYLSHSSDNAKEPTLFEKERFMDFLIELNIQIKNKQIEKEDVTKIFSIYIRLFDNLTKIDNQIYFHKREVAELSELL